MYINIFDFQCGKSFFFRNIHIFWYLFQKLDFYTHQITYFLEKNRDLFLKKCTEEFYQIIYIEAYDDDDDDMYIHKNTMSQMHI